GLRGARAPLGCIKLVDRPSLLGPPLGLKQVVLRHLEAVGPSLELALDRFDVVGPTRENFSPARLDCRFARRVFFEPVQNPGPPRNGHGEPIDFGTHAIELVLPSFPKRPPRTPP